MYRGIWDKEYRFFNAMRIRCVDELPADNTVTIIRKRVDKQSGTINYSMTTDAKIVSTSGTSIIGARVIGSMPTMNGITVISDDRELIFVDAKDGIFTSANQKYEFTTFFIDGSKFDYELAHTNDIYYVCLRLILRGPSGVFPTTVEVPTYGTSQENAIQNLSQLMDVSMTLGSPKIIRGPY